LKWPNDVVVDDKKLAGVLAEKDGNAVVVGMGLNVTWDELPEELAQNATACNLVAERAVSRDEVLVAWLLAFESRLVALDRVVTEAAEHSATLGRRVRVELADRSFAADAIALSDAGHLVVRTEAGTQETITAADVVHLRPSPR
jgi:BirA family biotin operon repressor/biotin-[acetyl-CoA-carboxylase] ligase